MLWRCGPRLLVLVALALAGCSGGGPDDDDAVTVSADTTTSASTETSTGRLPANTATRGSVSLVDESWVCRGRVDMDLVKVEIRTLERDAVYLREDCTGRIGRIEIDTWMGDGVKINAPEPAAHDLVIQGGYIRCHAQGPGGHQDGVQAMGGERITFEEIEINCTSEPNAQFYVSALHPGMPTDIVCDGCFLGPGAASTFFVDESVRSGARNTVICAGRFHTVRVDEALAVDLVFEGNDVLEPDDPRCAG